jgi:predicted nucleic acid-binding protein
MPVAALAFLFRYLYPLADQALPLAAQHRLRGADAVYAAVALAYTTTLISLDNEHLNRLSGIVSVLTPAQALAQIRATPPAL